VRKTLAIAEVVARKLRHDPSELLMRAAQPVLWLQVISRANPLTYKSELVAQRKAAKVADPLLTTLATHHASRMAYGAAILFAISLARFNEGPRCQVVDDDRPGQRAANEQDRAGSFHLWLANLILCHHVGPASSDIEKVVRVGRQELARVTDLPPG
jgi:hypothetical protein